MMRFLNPILGIKASVEYVETFLRSKKLIFFGEIHSNPKIIEMQKFVLSLLINEVRSEPESKVFVIMEHFAGQEHQTLLEQFMGKGGGTARMPLTSFLTNYKEVGEENHDLVPYSNLLEYARENSDVVELKAGFIPKSYAKLLVTEGSELALAAAYKDGYLDSSQTYIPGSDDHYNFFESLISGRYDLSLPPTDRFQKIFPAQIIKDSAMATIITKAMQVGRNDRYLVICGAGHCEYGFGVPERVHKSNVIQKDDSCIISTRNLDDYEIRWDDDNELSLRGPFEKVEGFENQFPADLIFFYSDDFY